jgi:hypothetical protein
MPVALGVAGKMLAVEVMLSCRIVAIVLVVADEGYRKLASEQGERPRMLDNISVTEVDVDVDCGSELRVAAMSHRRCSHAPVLRA